MSERLGALERRGSVADPSPLPLTPHPREDEDAALEELSLEAPGDSFSEEELHAIGFRATRSQWCRTCLVSTVIRRRYYTTGDPGG